MKSKANGDHFHFKFEASSIITIFPAVISLSVGHHSQNSPSIKICQLQVNCITLVLSVNGGFYAVPPRVGHNEQITELILNYHIEPSNWMME